MRTSPPQIGMARHLRYIALFVMAVALAHSQAATFWTGPNVTWTKSGSTPKDIIVAGKVELTRGGRDVLFNTAAGESSPGATSPKDCLFAFGTLANATSLTYASMESLRNSNLGARILNKDMVVHLVNEDIYFSIRFSTWGSFGAGTVSYTRSTAAAAPPPTVSLTSPAANAVFAAPATIALSANASVSGGTVTNVKFFAGATQLASVNASPFTASGSLATGGAYSITAVATAGGVSTTSAPVSITLVTPIDVTLTSPLVSGSNFSFNYSVNPGLRYVVQSTDSLASPVNWTPIVTNTASANPSAYSESFSAATAARFYRVGRMPNP